MCIRDRYQRRVHGDNKEEKITKEGLNPKIKILTMGACSSSNSATSKRSAKGSISSKTDVSFSSDAFKMKRNLRLQVVKGAFEKDLPKLSSPMESTIYKRRFESADRFESMEEIKSFDETEHNTPLYFKSAGKASKRTRGSSNFV
eukprot:TRINITY_DN31389_c0_g1_i1.p1 TRINITY_DN31389_c0_g1~~TRINITY_DN31389_c0_g1_i1.p1  ORF type:complete len:165 (+),score=51.68 TRINITY_DN31389_c0_g1_i1:61-495(+)